MSRGRCGSASYGRRGQSSLSPSRLSSAGTSVSVAATATSTTRIAPSAEAAEDRVRDQEHAEQRQHDGHAGEDDGLAGGAAGDLDRLELLAARAAAPRGSARR